MVLFPTPFAVLLLRFHRPAWLWLRHLWRLLPSPKSQVPAEPHPHNQRFFYSPVPSPTTNMMACTHAPTRTCMPARTGRRCNSDGRSQSVRGHRSSSGDTRPHSTPRAQRDVARIVQRESVESTTRTQREQIKRERWLYVAVAVLFACVHVRMHEWLTGGRWSSTARRLCVVAEGS